MHFPFIVVCKHTNVATQKKLKDLNGGAASKV